MVVLAACIVTVVAVLLLRTPLMRAPAVFYVLATLLGIVASLDLSTLAAVPIPESLVYVLKHGSVAFFLFAIVMYVGVLPETSRLRQYLMPVRGKLSIVASLVAVGHFAGYLAAFASGFLFRSAPVAPRTWMVFLLALALVALLIPLTVTSFVAIRNRMPVARWKQLQRWAYLFFALLYVHVAAMLAPTAMRGGDALVRFAFYTAVFAPYLALFFVWNKLGAPKHAQEAN